MARPCLFLGKSGKQLKILLFGFSWLSSSALDIDENLKKKALNLDPKVTKYNKFSILISWPSFSESMGSALRAEIKKL